MGKIFEEKNTNNFSELNEDFLKMQTISIQHYQTGDGGGGRNINLEIYDGNLRMSKIKREFEKFPE